MSGKNANTALTATLRRLCSCQLDHITLSRTLLFHITCQQQPPHSPCPAFARWPSSRQTAPSEWSCGRAKGTLPESASCSPHCSICDWAARCCSAGRLPQPLSSLTVWHTGFIGVLPAGDLTRINTRSFRLVAVDKKEGLDKLRAVWTGAPRGLQQLSVSYPTLDQLDKSGDYVFLLPSRVASALASRAPAVAALSDLVYVEFIHGLATHGWKYLLHDIVEVEIGQYRNPRHSQHLADDWLTIRGCGWGQSRMWQLFPESRLLLCRNCACTTDEWTMHTEDTERERARQRQKLLDASNANTSRLHIRFGGAEGLFGPFIRRVQSGGFAVQAAMLLLAHSVSKPAYLQRCLPPAALERVACDWDAMMLAAASAVLDLAADEADSGAVSVTLRRPLRLGGFGLSSAQFTSPLAFIASIASSAAQPGSHPLSDGALPSVSLLHQWLRAALTCPTVTDIQDHGCTGMHYDTDTFTTHFHNQPSHASNLQHRLTTVATNSLFSARVSQLQGVGGAERELARLHGGKARYAARWKTVRPTETAYRLSDEFYRYSARRDLGLPPTRDRVLQHRCGSCRMGICADGFHGQRCIHNSAFTKLRHDSIERLLHDIIRDGVGLAYRQQHGLPAADRTIPDLLIYLDNQAFLCDVTVTDTLWPYSGAMRSPC